MLARLARLFSLLVNAGLAGLVVAAALPGPQRMVAPGAYGLSEVAPGLWTDAPTRTRELVALTDRARARVGQFFGGPPPRPKMILCTRPACARDFGIGGNGLSIAFVAVMVSPGGLTLGTLTHELTHSRLHRSMGLRNLVRQPFPTWFDEGLATHVAGHPVWSGRVSAADRARVRAVRQFWSWDGAYRALGVGPAYAAAAAEVAAIEARAGRAGLLELIARAEAGEDFDAVLAEVKGR